MATPSVLTFDAEGRAVDFEVWVDDLQLFLQCDRADGLSLFDLTSGASPPPAANADATVRSQRATRNAVASLAVPRYLPTTERAYFSQYKSAQTLYDAVVARCSSPPTAALSRLMLPYLFPDLAAFPTVADLITHLRTSDTRYRAALPAEFCPKNPPPPPPMYITLYYIVTRLPDSLRVVKDHFLSVCPTTLTVDLLEKALLADEKSIVVVGASRGDPRTPSLRGVPPPPSCPLLPLLLRPTSLVLSRSALRLPRAGDAAPAKARGARALEGLAGAMEVVVEAVEGVGVVVGVVAGKEVSVAAVEAEEAAAVAEGAEAAVVVEATEATEVAEAAEAAVDLVAALRRGVAPVVVRASSSRVVVRPCPLSSFVSGTLRVSAVGVRVPAPTAGVAIFDLDFDAILAAMYAVDNSVAGDCYLCVPPDPGIEAAALGAGEAAALGASASAAQGTSASATPGAGESALSGCGDYQFTPASQRVTHCTFSRTGRHLATFTRRPGSSLYTLTTESPPAAEFAQVATSSQVFAAASRSGPESAPCSCRLLSNQTLLWHNRLGHPSLHRLRGMASRVLVSGLPRSLPPLPAGPGPTCVLCVERRQRAAPHSSEFPPTEAPLQTLHIDVWDPARVSGQGHERYILLVVDDYSRYTTVFPLRSKGDVTEQNGIAERRIGMVMDVARTSIMHAAAPHFLWPFAVQYPAHQINLQPRVSLSKTSPALRWTGKVGDASAFRVWGSWAFVRDLSADKLSPRAVPCVFLGFPPDAPRWQFYHPTSRRVLSSQDVTFDESVPYYRLFPYRTAPLPPPPLFLAPGPPSVDPLPPQGPAPSRVSWVDAIEPVKVAVDSGAARGAEPAGAGSGGAESGGAETGGAESGGAEPGGAGSGGAEPGGVGSARVAAGGASSRQEPLSPQELREWFARRWRRATGAGGTTATAGPEVRLGVRLRLVEMTVLLELVLLELELLELELLEVLAPAVLLALVLLWVLELALLELDVLLALVLPLGVLSPLFLL
ncbi:unnamed protein product [Closterium sp. NIES-65]|nr:unnamed protein product [Closterium sp. NIES-65]